MSEADLIERLADAIADKIQPAIPLTIALWDLETIALYLKMSKTSVSERYACLPDFPPAIRLPSRTGKRGHPLYRAKEIIRWSERYFEPKSTGHSI